MSGTLGCPRCLGPCPDGLLCEVCVAAFTEALAALATLLPTLADTAGRLDEVTRGLRHLPVDPDQVAAALPVEPVERFVPVYALAPHGLPINPDAVELTSKVRFTFATWIGHLRARYGDPHGWAPGVLEQVPVEGPWCPSCSHESCVVLRVPDVRLSSHAPVQAGPACGSGLRCRHASCARVRAGRVDATGWLLASLRAVRRDDAARAIVTEIVQLARRVEGMVDRRDPEVYVGPCDAVDVAVRLEDGVVSVDADRICGVELYARLGEQVVTCSACGTRYLVKDRKAFMVEAAREVWARPALIAQALAALDIDLTAARLDTWISRDKRRHARLCARPVGPVCEPGCGHPSCAVLRGRGCTRGHIVAVVDENGEPVADRPVYRVGDVLARVEALRAERAARELQEAI